MEMEKIGNLDLSRLKKESLELKNGLGALAWGVLELFKRGGMPHSDLEIIYANLREYFSKTSNDECNAILKVLEMRLSEDKDEASQLWYTT